MSVVQPGRKWKKASAFMLAAALFCSVPLSGCSSQGGGSGAGTASNSSEGTSTEPQKLVMFYPFQTSTSTSDNITLVETELEKKMAEDGLYIDLDWVIIPRDSFEEKKNTLLAGGDQLDGFIGDADDLGGDIQKGGLVRPITDLVDEYGSHLKEMIPDGTWAEVTQGDGEIYAIPSYNRTYWTGAVIRKDWLDEAGLDMPETLEDLEEAMEAFKKRDGVMPAGGKPWYIEPSMASAVTGGITAENGWETESPDGEFIQAYEHPDYVKFLEMYNRWLDNGWFDPDFLVTEETNYESMLYSGRLGIYFCDPTQINKYIPLLQAEDPDAELEVLPVLSGPMGEAALQATTGVRNVAYVTTMSEHPELVVKYFDWLVSDQENYKLGKYGVENTHYVIEEDGRWRSPDSAGGDDSKRGYEDIFAPLEFEDLMVDKQTLYYDTEALQDYYRSLPSYTHPFKDPKGNFVIDWTDIGNYNATDIWTEIYNIACGSRSLSDWQTVVDEYEASVKVAYDPIREQYREWKKSIGRS